MRYIVGLGNPGSEYESSRHNTGRIVLADFIKKQKIAEPEFDKKLKALTVSGKLDGKKFQIIFPETFMNKSGLSVKPLITSKKKAAGLIVVHDDIDLPLGGFKISVGKGSAGHKGVESIIRNIKTKDFTRIRVGIAPVTPKGKIRKPKGEKMLDFIIGNFKPEEIKTLKRVAKKITSALEDIILYGEGRAMSVRGK